MTLLEIKQILKQKLASTFDPIEINSLTSILIENTTGWNPITQALHHHELIQESILSQLHSNANELIAGKPIQYVTGEAWFLSERYTVNEKVLIPRPETEELVEWIIEYAHIIKKPLQILDIGTGSGCISIALKKALPESTLTGLDISEEALMIAKKNGEDLKADIHWIQQNILTSASLPFTYDIILSNPPYIPFKEIKNMQVQVKNYEPSIALFVANEDPLLFYRVIARLGKQHLSLNGQLFFEIHYDQGKPIIAMFDEMGYHAELRKDMYGKDRFVRARLKD